MELVHGALDGGHRILLFSQFTGMLDIIGKRLAKEDINLFLIDLIDSMKKEFPDIMLPVTIASASAILEKLENNEIDIAFIEGAFPQEKFNSIPLSSYQIIPVCAPAYIASASITIEELSLIHI